MLEIKLAGGSSKAGASIVVDQEVLDSQLKTDRGMSSELWRLSASEVARLVRTRKVSAREVADAALQRLDFVNPRITAIVDCRPDLVREQADRVDSLLARGNDPGPLAGVPVTVKINIDQAGFATTDGSRLYENRIAKFNSPAVDNMVRAGAVLLGRSNAPTFAIRWFTSNLLYGGTHTHNPRDPLLDSWRIQWWWSCWRRSGHRTHCPRDGHRWLSALSRVCLRRSWVTSRPRASPFLQRVFARGHCRGSADARGGPHGTYRRGSSCQSVCHVGCRSTRSLVGRRAFGRAACATSCRTVPATGGEAGRARGRSGYSGCRAAPCRCRMDRGGN